jgi:hypothetical protein
MRGLVNTCCEEFYLFPGIGWVGSTHVDIHFVSSLALDVFGQQIETPPLHGTDLANIR